MKANINDIITVLVNERTRAETLHPDFAESLEQAIVIIGEEFGELCKEICDLRKTTRPLGFNLANIEDKKSYLDDQRESIKTEATHVGATIIRLLENLDKLTGGKSC